MAQTHQEFVASMKRKIVKKITKVFNCTESLNAAHKYTAQ
jgi:hypothetical protein